MAENFKIDRTYQIECFDVKSAGHAVKIMSGSDGNSLIIALADFVANPILYADAIKATTTRPVQLKFV